MLISHKYAITLVFLIADCCNCVCKM